MWERSDAPGEGQTGHAGEVAGGHTGLSPQLCRLVETPRAQHLQLL